MKCERFAFSIAQNRTAVVGIYFRFHVQLLPLTLDYCGHSSLSVRPFSRPAVAAATAVAQTIGQLSDCKSDFIGIAYIAHRRRNL